MAIDYTKLMDPGPAGAAYRKQLQSSESLDGRDYRSMIRDGWTPPKPTDPAPPVPTYSKTPALRGAPQIAVEGGSNRITSTINATAHDPRWGYLGAPSGYQELTGGGRDTGDGGAIESESNKFTKDGQEFYRVGAWGGESMPKVIRDAGLANEFKWDPTYGYYVTPQAMEKMRSLFPKESLFGGPSALVLGAFGLPYLTSLGVLGGAAAGSGAEAAASAGGAEVAGGAGSFAGSLAPTITPGTVAGAELGVGLGELAGVGSLVGPTLPAIEGISSGALSGILSGAGSVIDLGGLGSYTINAAGELVPHVVDLANSAGTVPVSSLPNLPSSGAGGGSGGAGGASNPATQATGSALSKFLKDNLGIEVGSGALGLLGDLLGTGLGVYGANKQAESMEDLYDKFLGLGKPYRDALSQLNANPSSFYSSPIVQGALQQGSDALSRSLSAKVGNPILNPTALQEMQNYTSRGLLDAYNNRWNQLASAGQLGVSQAAPLGVRSADAQSGVYDALGAGLGSVFGNQRDYAGELMDILRGRNNVGGYSLA